MRFTNLLLLLSLVAPAAQAKLPKLKGSDNGHFLVHEDGSPFYYVADTAWELFHRLDREEVDLYLTTRAKQRYSVIMAVALAEHRFDRPNPYGHLPLVDNDPARPVHEYFRHVDYVVDKAESLGMYTGLLPTWGDKFNKKWGGGPEIFTPENARAYGLFLGKRYKDKPIIWILGGDRPIDTDKHLAIVRAMAAGIREGAGPGQLMTYHINGELSSSGKLHDEPWLDFNMMQSGHARRNNAKSYQLITQDWNRKPAKPCIDSESNYEDHPINWDAKRGYFTDHDVRKLAHWQLFAGGFGISYGCQSVWQFYSDKNPPIAEPRTHWPKAILLPAATQMQHLRALVESRPYTTRIPDQSLLEDEGKDGSHRRATRDESGSYAWVYSPTAEPFTVNLGKLAPRLRAAWYDPRTGESTIIGEFTNDKPQRFVPIRTDVVETDSVLLLDDVTKNYPLPGKQ